MKKRMYEEVYRFLRRRENRAATIERIVEVTGVTEDLLHKWVRKGRLNQHYSRILAIHATNVAS